MEGSGALFQKEMRLKDFDAEFLCHELQMIVHVGGDSDTVFETLGEFQVPEPTEGQMIQMTDLLMDAWNCTRMVTNRGFTPNEMKGMESSGTEGGRDPGQHHSFSGTAEGIILSDFTDFDQFLFFY